MGQARLNKRSLRIHPIAQSIGDGINNGDDPVHKTLLKTLGVSAATVALALFGYAAQAQAPAPKDATPKAAPKAAAKKPPPKCTTLKTQAPCEAREDCAWTQASIDEKTKKQKKAAYCHAKPKAPAKKEPAKK